MLKGSRISEADEYNLKMDVELFKDSELAPYRGIKLTLYQYTLLLNSFRTFQGLELDKNLQKSDGDARCGLHIIDLTTGDIVHWIRLGGIIDELFDVKTLPNVKRPMVIGTQKEEIRRLKL